MKTKIFLSRAFFLCASLIAGVMSAHAQLYVKNNGFVGIATTNPWYALHVAGDGYFRVGSNVIRILPNNGGTEIGTSTDKLTFWYSNTGHNKLYAEKFSKVSDATVKENIQPLTDGLEIVLQMEPKSYNLTDEEDSLGRREYGFLAQDVEEFLPDLVSEDKEIKLLDYDQIIPFLVLAIQEQQEILESMSKTIVQGKSLETHAGSFLEQNNPNPFNENTYIRYGVAEGVMKASIMIFNLQGTLLKTYPILRTGTGEVIIEGKDLKAGMYIYALVADGKEVDSRKMILSK